MSGATRVPGEVIAAIAAALSLALGVTPDRLHIHLLGAAPADDDRGAWQLLSTMEQMRRRTSR